MQWIAPQREASPQQLWDTCPHGDWLLWLAGRINIKRETLVLAACDCARLSLVYVPAGELRPLQALETAEAWARGDATLDEVNAAAVAARAAAYAADAVAARATAYAADAAAVAARATAYAADAAAVAAVLQQCADLVRVRISYQMVEQAMREGNKEGALG
jgi:hypothetical protein